MPGRPNGEKPSLRRAFASESEAGLARRDLERLRAEAIKLDLSVRSGDIGHTSAEPAALTGPAVALIRQRKNERTS
jgi:hypothetical protein